MIYGYSTHPLQTNGKLRLEQRMQREHVAETLSKRATYQTSLPSSEVRRTSGLPGAVFGVRLNLNVLLVK